MVGLPMSLLPTGDQMTLKLVMPFSASLHQEHYKTYKPFSFLKRNNEII